ncbi:MAG: PBP1A family penicillin-binding protein [bacterium]|nr:PBP1A family penicillin-binding protein [bacterium]
MLARVRLAHVSLLGLSLVIGGGVGLLVASLQDLPEVKALEHYRPQTVSRLYDKDERLIATFYSEKRILVPLGSVPASLIRALIATEDARFYEHRGIDPKGIARALWTDIKAGRIVEGGSTITQQLAKVLFLTPERSLRRKLKEAILALQIERTYSKDQILGFYLNQVYMGSGAYGIEAAARTYFGRSVEELSLSEGAMLAGLPRAPSRYSPLAHPDIALRRRAHVLGRMAKLGYITAEEAERASGEPLRLSPKVEERHAPYFVEHVRRIIEKTQGASALYHGGLHISTTLDLDLQRAAEEALIKGAKAVERRAGWEPLDPETPLTELTGLPTAGELLTVVIDEVRPNGLVVAVGDEGGFIPVHTMEWAKITDPTKVFGAGEPVQGRLITVGSEGSPLRYTLALDHAPRVQGALVALDVATGAIRAMVGGVDFTTSQFNRATQARRQPGSAFKPFIYAAALDNGYTAADRLADAPVVYDDPVTGEPWKPTNFEKTFRGWVTVRTALEHSINVATVRLLTKIGPSTAVEYAERLGINPSLRPYLSLALGAFEVTPLEVTSAYGVFANGGIRVEPYAVQVVTDGTGAVVSEHVPSPRDVLSAETAYLMNYLLQGVVKHGTGRVARRVGRQVAVKTGTTNDFQDAWFIGYAPQLVVGVWVGRDDNRSLGKGATGARAAGPIWVRFMRHALKGLPAADFPVPGSVHFLEVDRRTGLLSHDGCGPTIREAFIEGTEPTRPCTETTIQELMRRDLG